MSPRQTLVGWGTVLAASVLLCFSLSAGQAPRPERQAPAAEEPAGRAPTSLLPADPVLYVGWDGEAAHREAWEQTAAYQALYESGLIGVAQQMFVGLTPQASGEQAELLNAVLETARLNGISLAVTVPEADGPTLPWGVIVLHGGADLEPRIGEAIRSMIQPGAGVDLRTEERSGRTITTARFEQFPVADLGWWTDGGHLVVAAGVGAVNHALAVAEGDAEDVTTSRLWKAYRTGEQPFEVASFAWLDAAKLLKAIGPIPVPAAGPDRPPVTLAQFAEAIGLDDLRAMVLRTGFQGPATVTDIRVEMTEDRDGLAALGFQEPITLDALPPLPQRLSGFGVASFDFSKFYDALLNTVRAVVKLGPPKASQEVESGLEKIRKAVGLDVKADLLDPLGNVLCVYNDSAQGPLGLGFTIAISVNDADKFRTSIDVLLDRLARRFPPKQLNIRRTDKHGRQVVTLEVAEAVFNPSFVVTDEWLVVSVVPQAVETFLLRTDGKLPRWKPEGELAEALEGLPTEFTQLRVSDPRETYRFLAGLAPVVLPIVRKVAAQGGEVSLDVAVADLPPAEVVAEPLFPNVSVTYVEGNVVVNRSRSSLPGLFVGDGSGVGVATTAVAVALLLPAVQAAREAARRTQSKNNLKQIGLAFHLYHDAHGHFPPAVIEENGVKRSWRVELLPYLEQQALYERYRKDEPWDSEHNKQVLAQMPAVYKNPSDPSGPTIANYVLLTHPDALFSGKPIDLKAGGKGTAFRDVTDGLSNTILAVETTRDVPWTKPEDIPFDPEEVEEVIEKELGGYHTGGFLAALADGSVHFLSEDIAPETFKALVTARGGEPIGDF